MADDKWSVEGRSFRTEYDYKAALRDKKKIDAIHKKIDITNGQAVLTLQKALEKGTYQFETIVGRDFEDEIEELAEKAKNNPGNAGGLKKKQKKQRTAKADSRIETIEMPPSLEECDEDFKQEVLNQLKVQERKRRLMLVALSIIAVVSLSYFTYYYYIADRSADNFAQLAELKNSSLLSNQVQAVENAQGVQKNVIDKYKTLYSKNKGLIGWVKIDDTLIDYPVMQTENQDYYLDHNYKQEKDKNGSIFMDKACDAMEPSMNLIIYGHNMKSGKMFGSLEKYVKKEYYDKHKYIDFDTLYEEGKYEIMYVFRSKLYSEEEIVFKYYQFTDADTEEEFYSNMNEMAALSIYDTGVTAEYGEQLITLSTCDYNEKNGRFVVVAKKIE